MPVFITSESGLLSLGLMNSDTYRTQANTEIKIKSSLIIK